ncbi:MAG: SDR family NAD(P)-dependent oxidoreductase, partial [Halioglobus sp.]
FDAVEEKTLPISVLVNNAGIGLNGQFTTLGLDDQLGMIQLNVNSLTELTHRFLAGMKARNEGWILQVASTYAFQPGAGYSGQLFRIAPALLVICLLMSAPIWWATLQWELVLGTVSAGLFALCYLRLVAGANNPGAFRLLVTSTFGVIHGFGFAGGLLEFDFPAADMAFVLLGFNLGVELGQLLVLLAVILLLLGMRRFVSMRWQQRGANATVTALSALGTYWFVGRLIG